MEIRGTFTAIRVQNKTYNYPCNLFKFPTFPAFPALTTDYQQVSFQKATPTPAPEAGIYNYLTRFPRFVPDVGTKSPQYPDCLSRTQGQCASNVIVPAFRRLRCGDG